MVLHRSKIKLWKLFLWVINSKYTHYWGLFSTLKRRKVFCLSHTISVSVAGRDTELLPLHRQFHLGDVYPGCFSKEVSTLVTSIAVFSLMMVVNGLLQKGLCLKEVSVLPGLSTSPFAFVTHLSVVAANIVKYRIFLSSVKLKWITVEVNSVYNMPKDLWSSAGQLSVPVVQSLPLAWFCPLKPPGCLKQSLTSWGGVFCFAVMLCGSEQALTTFCDSQLCYQRTQTCCYFQLLFLCW